MLEGKSQNALAKLNTYIFVDVSNIRSACLKTLRFKIDFYKMMGYWKEKYSHLKSVNYYEGIANNDAGKQEEFDKLAEAGYTVRPLERKSYTEPAVYKEVCCKNCKTRRRIQIMKKTTKLKSNVDVYLATELLEIAFLAKKPIHIILVACDGDYAEMIKRALATNKNIRISVLATSVVPRVKLSNGKFKDINSCSTRLQVLKRENNPRFCLVDIRDIQDYIR